MVCCSCFGVRPRLNKTSRSSSSSTAQPARPLSVSETPQNHQTQIFTYRELAIATNSFRAESLIGRGGFGAVFKGVLPTTGQNVAVKMLDTTGVQGDKEFLVEVLMLSLLRHQNLVKLIGYCAEGDQRMVVYEYMPLGSVEDHIHNRRAGQVALDWNTRMQIAAGAAKGLEHLHNKATPPVIYRDLKTANILLDQDYNAKLSDFGLAKFGPSGEMSHVSTRVMGTLGYCAPEYANTGKLTMKSDIYSFGVVMLELITGRRAMMNSYAGRDCYLVNWAWPFFIDNKIKEAVDPELSIQSRYMESTVRKALELAFMCLREDANARPTINEVVVALDYIVKCTAKIQKRLSSGRGDSKTKGEVMSSPRETSRMLNKNKEEDEEVNREKAVTEAKFWAKNLIDLNGQGKQPSSPSP